MNYIVSGLGPSNGGTGRLVQRLSLIAPRYDCVLTSRRPPVSVKGYLRKGHIGYAALEIMHRYWGKQVFDWGVSQIKKRHVIAIHPQTLGYDNLFKLVDNGNRVSLYVMDNSFFCVRSYNHFPGEFEPCTRCLGGSFQNAEQCTPAPVGYSRTRNIAYLQKLMRYKARVHFVLQNNNQLELLERHFGAVSTSIAGLYTTDMLNDPLLVPQSCDEYDVVYHAAAIEPKGILYTLQLAALVPERTFLIPASKTSLVGLCDQYGIDLGELRNVALKDMTWDRGLASAVRQAGLVICPTLWSAPIEGALIKSLLFNGKVAVVDTKFSFAQELSEDVVLKLPSDVVQAAAFVDNYFIDNGQSKRLEMNARRWVEGYLDQHETMTARLFAAFDAD